MRVTASDGGAAVAGDIGGASILAGRSARERSRGRAPIMNACASPLSSPSPPMRKTTHARTATWLGVGLGLCLGSGLGLGLGLDLGLLLGLGSGSGVGSGLGSVSGLRSANPNP